MPDIGQSLSHYSITERIGKGGMGEVFRARDQKLGRDVAIKVLPEEFARDTDRVARFQREAKLLASLNHPNIAAIYGLEESGGTQFLVLELVEGDTLADRIKAGPIPVEESLKLALQIAGALEIAHDKGIIHRDLKPSNIKVTPEGTVKVLDFGLAKALEGEAPMTDSSQSPTLSLATTGAGVILGTAAYMSPEQARGKTVDRRADIWAFGAVLWEMLTGKQPFIGDSVTETLAAILKGEPDWEALPAGSPVGLLRRCLEKDPKRRLRDIGDAVIEPEFGTIPSSAGQAISRQLFFWVMTLIAAAAVLYALWPRTPSVPRTVARLSIPLPQDQELADYPAISPDGQTIAYVSRKGADEPLLYLRNLNSFDARAVAGSGGAQQPFFSPDGKGIAFFAHGQLQKAEVAGGSPIRVAEAAFPIGGTWNKDDTIIFTAAFGSGLLRVPAGGGKPESLTKPDGADQGYAHAWPQALADGRSVLFAVWGATRGNAVLSLDTRRWRLIDRWWAADVVSQSAGSTARLLSFDFNADIRAASFDLAHAAITSAYTSVLSDVFFSPRYANSWLAVSRTGTAVYALGNPSKMSIAWVDYEGKAQQIGTEQAMYEQLALSPDGSRALVSQMRDLWVYDLQHPGMRTRLTLQTNPLETYNMCPVWSRDGSRVYYGSNRGGDWDIYSQAADGSQPAEVLLKRPYDQVPFSMAPDGTLLFHESNPAAGWDIWALSPEGKVTAVRATSFNDKAPICSPDGRWIAFESDESGRSEIYVQIYPSGAKRVSVSTGGGVTARWSRDGRTLFYIAGNAMMTVVMGPDGSPASAPRKLFESSEYLSEYYDLSPDGKRFLMIRRNPGFVPRQLNVILNWADELDRLVPVKKK